MTSGPRRGQGQTLLHYTHSSQMTSSPTVKNCRELSPNDFKAQPPNPQINELG